MWSPRANRGSYVHSPVVQRGASRALQHNTDLGQGFDRALAFAIPETDAWPELSAILKRRKEQEVAAARKTAIEQEIERRRDEVEERAQQAWRTRRAEQLAKNEAARLAADRADEEAQLAALQTRKYWLNTETAFHTLRKPQFFTDYGIDGSLPMMSITAHVEREHGESGQAGEAWGQAGGGDGAGSSGPLLHLDLSLGAKGAVVCECVLLPPDVHAATNSATNSATNNSSPAQRSPAQRPAGRRLPSSRPSTSAASLEAVIARRAATARKKAAADRAAGVGQAKPFVRPKSAGSKTAKIAAVVRHITHPPIRRGRMYVIATRQLTIADIACGRCGRLRGKVQRGKRCSRIWAPQR